MDGLFFHSVSVTKRQNARLTAFRLPRVCKESTHCCYHHQASVVCCIPLQLLPSYYMMYLLHYCQRDISPVPFLDMAHLTGNSEQSLRLYSWHQEYFVPFAHSQISLSSLPLLLCLVAPYYCLATSIQPSRLWSVWQSPRCRCCLKEGEFLLPCFPRYRCLRAASRASRWPAPCETPFPLLSSCLTSV